MSDVPGSVALPPIRAQARAAVARAWDRAVASGALPDFPADATRPPVEIERPADSAHGDFASNLAMKLARPYRMAPLAIAQALAAEVTNEAAADPTSTPIASADVAPPGFLNIRLRDGALEATVAAILADPPAWGRVAPTRPRSVNVEFVSANPTGPLHIGNARGAFIGDLLSRVLEAGGQQVTREYYFNDSGAQIGNLGASVVALKRGEPVPEDGYQGAYVHELVAAVPDDIWTAATADGADTAAVIGRWAAGRVREGIEASLEALGVHFDVWTSEARLHDEGWVARAVERLRERGHVYEQDGAVWFRSTAFGDDKDRVIYRSTGEPTYFAADIGYVTEKLDRGFDHLIYIWGADHHGTVARVRNAAEAMGYDREAVQVLLYSWVRFVRDGQEISMSKRAGEFITLDELLAEVGVDAARWFFASRAVDDRDRLRHRAGQEAVEREPGLLRPVRARPDRLDPAQGRRRRAGARPRRGGDAVRRARSGAGPGDRPLPRGRRGRGRGRGDAGRHGLRDRAGHDVPRLLSGCARRGSGRAGSVRGTPRPGRGGPDHARQRARVAGDLGARVDVAGGSGRSRAGAGGRPAERVRSRRPPAPRSRCHPR